MFRFIALLAVFLSLLILYAPTTAPAADSYSTIIVDGSQPFAIQPQAHRAIRPVAAVPGKIVRTAVKSCAVLLKPAKLARAVLSRTTRKIGKLFAAARPVRRVAGPLPGFRRRA